MTDTIPAELVGAVDRLTDSLTVGAFYLVPTVRYMWLGKSSDWPVIGPKHTDAKILGFPHAHYHVDGRFVRRAPRQDLVYDTDLAALIAKYPLAVVLGGGPAPHPEVVYRRRKCVRASITFPFMFQHQNFVALHRAFENATLIDGPEKPQ